MSANISGRSIALYIVTGVIAVCGVLHWATTPNSRRLDPARTIQATVAPVPVVINSDPEKTSSSRKPASLVGSTAPRLPLDSHGHLAKVHAVREFFDYCLTAQNDLSPFALDAFVQREIAAQLDGTFAQAEALDVWKRYRTYQSELAKLSGEGQVSNGKLDPDAIRQALDQRASVADRTLGDWAMPFFGDEEKQQHVDVERIGIMQDASLTDAQKKARLAALDQQLPADARVMKAALAQQQSNVSQLHELQKAGVTADALRDQASQLLGPEAANRVVQMRSDEEAWQAKYNDYAAERAQISGQGLAQEDRDAQIAQLRQRYFTNPGDAIRAASLDRGVDGK